MTSRREFLRRTGASAIGLGLAACSAPAAPTRDPELDSPMMGGMPPVEETPVPRVVSTAPGSGPTVVNGPPLLIVIQLSGGDDGLNAVVPYGDGLYYQLRPQLAIPADQVIPLDGRLGLHPNLQGFKTIWDQGKLAILQTVGYPDPSRSHFRSMDIWHTGTLDASAENGWLGSFMAQAQRADQGPFQCVAIGNTIPRALQHEHASASALVDAATFSFQTDRRLPGMRDSLIQAFGALHAGGSRSDSAAMVIENTWAATARGVDQLKSVGETYRPASQYAFGPFGRGLQQAAAIAATDLGTRVLYVSIGGFDTHANQRNTHASLLGQLADGLLALQQDLERSGQADRTLILAFSEFGRRVAENGSAGTDHGAAGPVFVIGSRVKGGLYGDYPRLNDLVEGDLKHTIDFRQVYATVLEDWFRVSGLSVLGSSFPRLGFVG